MKQSVIVIIFVLMVSYGFSQEQVKEISLQEAIKSALENNLDLTVEKYNPEISATLVSRQKGVFFPNFYSVIQNASSVAPASSDLQGALEVINKDFVYNFGLNYLNPYGTTINVAYQNDRLVTNNLFLNYNPLYTSVLSFSINQPLLENFGKENTQYFVIKAENNKKISDLTYQQKILDTILATQNAYWDLVFTYDMYKVKQESIELANKLLQETQVRVSEGDAAPIEELASKAEVAKREEELITSENNIEKVENVLKMLIDGSAEPETLMYRIHPTDKPEFKEFPVDLNSCIAAALKNRPELSIIETTIASGAVDEKHFKNALLPTLNLKLGAGLNGIGGNRLIYEGLFIDRKLVSTIPGGYGGAMDELFSGNYHNWGIGFEFIYPLSSKQDRANYLRAQLEKEKSLITKIRIKQRIILQIKNSTREIQQNYKRIEAAKVSTELMTEKLKAEEEKLAEGISTNYYILDFQEDLASAKANEIAALIAYHKSIAQLQHAMGLSGK